MSRTSVKTAVAAMKSALEAMVMPAEYGGGAAFSKVKEYDYQDLGRALEELMLVQHRVALVVVSQVRTEDRYQGRELRLSRTLELHVIVTDRKWTDAVKAMYGDDTTPGAIGMAELLTASVCGPIGSNLVAVPEAGEPFTVSPKAQAEMAGRMAWSQDYRIELGDELVPLERRSVTNSR